jgi:DNA-directed RNA polymerase specialized sigma24 family protein
MAEDHDQRLADVAEAYVEARRALVQTLLIARADGYSYAEMARVTGLDEGAVRRLVRPTE